MTPQAGVILSEFSYVCFHNNWLYVENKSSKGGRGELCEKKSLFVTCFTFIKCLQDRANISV